LLTTDDGVLRLFEPDRDPESGNARSVAQTSVGPVAPRRFTRDTTPNRWPP